MAAGSFSSMINSQCQTFLSFAWHLVIAASAWVCKCKPLQSWEQHAVQTVHAVLKIATCPKSSREHTCALSIPFCTYFLLTPSGHSHIPSQYSAAYSPCITPRQEKTIPF